MHRNNETISRIGTALLGLAAVSLVAMIIAYPDQAFSASLSGLTIWWELVFPALLPFFILSELLLAFGVVHAIGVLLEPLMRTLFRLPGRGGWAVAMSMTAGFPAGAKAAADLRRDDAVTREEGSRLLAVSHLCSPIFITGVIAVGFWGSPAMGLPLIIIHFISALATGILVGRLFFRAAEFPHEASPSLGLASIIGAMVDGRRQDGRPLGRLLGDAVSSSVQSLLVIGGCIIVFSVLLQLLSIIGLTGALINAVQWLMLPLGMPPQLAHGAVYALFELHLGAYNISKTGDFSVWSAVLISSLIGWGGLSVHAQVKSLIGGTDLRYTPYLLSRLLHAAVSVFLTFALWDGLQSWLGPFVPAFAAVSRNAGAADGIWAAWPSWIASLQTLAGFLLASVALSLIIRVVRARML